MLTPRTGSTHLLLFHTFIVVVLLLTAKKPRRGWPRAERAAATWAIMAIDRARRGVCVCASDGRGCQRPRPVPRAWDHVGGDPPCWGVAAPGAGKASPRATLGLKPACHNEEKGGLGWEGAQCGVSLCFALEGLRPAVSHLPTSFFLASQQRRGA